MSGLKFRKPDHENLKRELARNRESSEMFYKFVEGSRKVSQESLYTHVDF